MLKILTYPEIAPTAWQELVDSSPYATWFQTKEAYEFYAANPEEMTPFAFGVLELEAKGERLKVKGTENSAAETVASTLYTLHPTQTEASTPYALHYTPALKGVIVGYITRERNALKQFLTRRAIIIGGPLLAEDATAEEIAALLNAVKKLQRSDLQPAGRSTAKRSTGHSPIYIETRNFHDYSKWRNIFEANGFAYQPHLNFHVDTTSIELAQRNIGKHRWRYIRLSMRDGAKIIDNPTIEQVRAFYTILQDLYRTKVRTPLWSWDFFERLYHTEHARYILVELDGQIVGGTACVCLPGKAVYEWYACGLDNCRDNIRPLSVAVWGEMQYAAENGYPLFDFMGAGKPDEAYGVRDFKAEFGGELVEHGRFLCIRKPLLYWIGKIGVKWLKWRRV